MISIRVAIMISTRNTQADLFNTIVTYRVGCEFFLQRSIRETEIFNSWVGKRVCMNTFHNNSVFGWNQILSHNSESFAWNRHHLEINVFLSTIQFTPIFVILTDSSQWPIRQLTFSWTVGSLETSTTQFVFF